MLQSILSFLSSVAFFVISVFGVNMSTEQQRYDVIERIRKNIEIRQYPQRIVAQTTMDTSKSDNPRGDAFRIVAAYIFGANKARQKIDMTAPVEIASPSGTIPMTAPVEVNTTNNALVGASSLTAFGAGAALDRALQVARITRVDIDVALVYDCFTIALLINVEDLGFTRKGEAGAAFRSGAFRQGDKLPVNMHGGLLSHGYPGRAAGIGNLIESVVQLRQDAGDRQVAGAEVALVHGMGGLFATHGVLLLGAA